MILLNSPETGQNDTVNLNLSVHDCIPINKSSVLRVVGTIVVLFSAFAFLLEKVGVLQDALTINRYFGFLGFTIALTVFGIVCGFFIKEMRSARTFLGLSASLLPVHFAQLGGFNYRVFGAMNFKGAEAFRMVANSPSTVVAVSVISVFILGVISYFTFSVFAKKSRVPLTCLYLFSCLTLLIPFRDSTSVIFMTLVSLAIVYHYYKNKILLNNLLTKEVCYATTMIFTPFLILPIRSLVNYSVTDFKDILTLLFFVLWVFFSKVNVNNFKNKYFVKSIDLVGITFGLLGFYTLFLFLSMSKISLLNIDWINLEFVYSLVFLLVPVLYHKTSKKLLETIIEGSIFVVFSHLFLFALFLSSKNSFEYVMPFVLGATVSLLGLASIKNREYSYFNDGIKFIRFVSSFSLLLISVVGFVINLNIVLDLGIWAPAAAFGCLAIFLSAYVEKSRS